MHIDNQRLQIVKKMIQRLRWLAFAPQMMIFSFAKRKLMEENV